MRKEENKNRREGRWERRKIRIEEEMRKEVDKNRREEKGDEKGGR